MLAVSRTTMRLAVLMLIVASSVGASAQPSLDEVRRLVREFRLDEALSAIDERLAANPSDRQARFLKGVVLAERKEDVKAIEVFTALAEDYPTLPEPYNNLAVLHASRGDYEKARDALLKAINTHPSYATAHENLGDIYAKMAGLAYGRALSLDTANAAAKDKLALIDDLFTRGGAPTTVASAKIPPTSVAEPAATVVAAATRPAVEAPPKAVAQPRATPTGAVAAVEPWAAAWSAQDVERYLGHYLPGTSPVPGLSRRQWEAKRRVRLKKPASIEVGVGNFQVRSAGESQ
jgi:tetratricopeptide (TPR) repeat protein